MDRLVSNRWYKGLMIVSLFVLVEVNVTGPRPPTDAPLEELPAYSAVWEGEHDGDDSD